MLSLEDFLGSLEKHEPYLKKNNRDIYEKYLKEEDDKKGLFRNLFRYDGPTLHAIYGERLFTYFMLEKNREVSNISLLGKKDFTHDGLGENTLVENIAQKIAQDNNISFGAYGFMGQRFYSEYMVSIAEVVENKGHAIICSQEKLSSIISVLEKKAERLYREL